MNNTPSPQIEPLPFNPAPGLGSPHIQTFIACFSPVGAPPPSKTMQVHLPDGDILACEISTPPDWKENDKTVLMLHGLGGCHSSPYMVRMARKLFQAGVRAIRVNLRSCGTGLKLSKRPYHAGVSHDILEVVKQIKKEAPATPLIIIGYSLGGNIAIKLAGELGEKAQGLIEKTIAVCAPIDLQKTAEIMLQPKNKLYNMYYMKQLETQSKRWTEGKSFSTIYEFDDLVTVPLWGFKDPIEYYETCSGRVYLPLIKHPCYLLFADDDPFINYHTTSILGASSFVKVWAAPSGGHMGFFGWADDDHKYYWMDYQLFKWILEPQ